MSKIPEDIKQKIEDNYFFVDEEYFDDSHMDYDDYVKERMALQRAASFGYSLSLERIAELEKEVEFWKGKLANCLESQNNDEENL